METTHTRGAWSCRKSENARPESIRVDIVTDAGEFSPSFICGDALPEDAALIAAAPILLDALKGLMKQVVKDAEIYAPEGYQAIWAFIEDASDAIGKAQGKK